MLGTLEALLVTQTGIPTIIISSSLYSFIFASFKFCYGFEERRSNQFDIYECFRNSEGTVLPRFRTAGLAAKIVVFAAGHLFTGGHETGAAPGIFFKSTAAKHCGINTILNQYAAAKYFHIWIRCEEGEDRRHFNTVLIL